MRREAAFLGDILTEADLILKHMAGCSEEQFMADPILSRAVLHSLMIMGEAANRVPEDFREKYRGALPWRELAGLRNRIVHDYPGIDLELVWDLVQNRLGKLREQVAAIIAAEGFTESGVNG